MSRRDRMIAIAVVVIFGCNFLAIAVTIEHFPPLFAAALRFAVIALPVMLFVPWPNVRVRWLIGFGLGFGAGQFAFLFVGMHNGMPAGLASLVLQSSAPFTVLLGAFLLSERLTPRSLAGIGLAIAGLAVIATYRAESAAFLPVLFTLLAGFSWALGNVSTRLGLNGTGVNPLHFTLWASIVPPLPLFALSALVEGPTAGWVAVAEINTRSGWLAVGALSYIVFVSTIIGSGLWSTLIHRNPAGVVAPFSMLVPIVGMSVAFLVLGERLAPIEIAAGAAVIIGVLAGASGRGPVEPTPVANLVSNASGRDDLADGDATSRMPGQSTPPLRVLSPGRG